jgi:hypothetical protein
MLHRVPVTRDGFGDPCRGLALLEGRLRAGVDPMREVENLVAMRLHGVREALLGFGKRLRGTGGGKR